MPSVQQQQFCVLRRDDEMLARASYIEAKLSTRIRSSSLPDPWDHQQQVLFCVCSHKKNQLNNEKAWWTSGLTTSSLDGRCWPSS